ncbi:uncharacterized protein JN550_011849 [Neoarthrinium moseri]|uniref:uncharacterized protein n=1 Tax=Neoarthrinium moseri TaxID=1658444 RepID=UPI001FDB0A37|nr:uncharacterized protein JN550_011849 [Neoarthrinium moseri]KAI1859654.1 hypothetical protein JN550_011849 [Neoarthrinium moseri]
MLEGMLKQKGIAPPPAVHPPKTRQEAPSTQDGSAKDDEEDALCQKPDARIPSPAREVPSPPDSMNEDFNFLDSDNTDQADSILLASTEHHLMSFHFPPQEPLALRTLDPKQEDVIHRLLSTKGNLSFDQLSGRLRFFGPTANSHVYAESSDKFDSREPPEQVRRADRIIRSLTTTTYDYLMNMFWEHYNGVLVVIDRQAFESDRESQSPKFYSSFLHITMLAAGYRFADKDRDDIIKIGLGNRESTLHREAKYMLDIELERPGGIPSVQALLLLGDLECGVGRDNTGWMYSGMANRLAFDIGLHLDCSDNGLPEREVSIRHMTMRACVIYDKYWALFLGRPTSIKNQDIGMDLLSRQFSTMLTTVPGSSKPPRPVEPPRSRTQEIYDQLVELMELAGRIVEIRESNKPGSNREPNLFAAAEAEDNAYLHVINLDRQLQNWYRRLPDHLTWKPANIKTAPFSFFLLHQQYHVSMILLHRPWAKYRSLTDEASTNSHPSPEKSNPSPEPVLSQNSLGLGDPTSIVVDSRTTLSRSICTQQAMRVARIFWQHRQRFDGKKVFVTGIQHAGTAAIALIAALSHHQNESDRRHHLGYLEAISHAIHDMSEAYHPAERMDALLNAVIIQLKQDLSDPYRTRTNSCAQPAGSGLPSECGGTSSWQSGNISVTPARRENTDADHGHAHKKRSRPPASRRASEFARPPAPFSASLSQHTPPASGQRQDSMAFEIHNSMAEIYSGYGNTSATFNLDSLHGSAIDGEPAGEAQSSGIDRPSEDYIVVNTATDSSWNMQGISQDHTFSNQDTGFQISDWVSGPAGLSATTVLHGSAQGTSSGEDHGRSPKTGDNYDRDANMDWIGGDSHSPISLEGLVQSVERAAGAEVDKSAAPRNHELDFFSF